MIVVFKNEAETLTLRLNSLKMSLLVSDDFSQSAIKYPEKSVISNEVAKYVQRFQVKYPGITDIFFKDNSADKRTQLVFLIKILWGVSLIKKETKNKDSFSISIKPETPIKEVSKILNKLIVFVNS